MYISIGADCHAASNLRALGLRKESYPFDWLLIQQNRVFEYINELINTNFEYFTTDLKYNHRGKVVSNNYDYVEFFHHNLITNKVLNRPEDDGKDLVELMHRRAKKFMNLITNKDANVVFLCKLHHTKLVHSAKLYKDMIKLENNNNILCKFKILVYLCNENEDYELIVPAEFKSLTKFIFKKYIKNEAISKLFGCKEDFKVMLESI